MSFSQYEKEQAEKKLLVKKLNNVITKGIEVAPMEETKDFYCFKIKSLKDNKSYKIVRYKQPKGYVLFSITAEGKEHEILSVDAAKDNMVKAEQKVWVIHNKNYKWSSEKKGWEKIEKTPNFLQKLFGQKIQAAK